MNIPPIAVRKNPARMLWEITYACCDTHPMRFHDWVLAMRIATGHQCPPPYAKARKVQKRLTRTIR